MTEPATPRMKRGFVRTYPRWSVGALAILLIALVAFVLVSDPTYTGLVINRIPTPDHPRGFDALLHQLGDWVFTIPSPIQFLAIALLIRLFPYVGVLAVTLFVAMMRIDFNLALLALLTGRTWWLIQGANILDRPWTVLGWVRSILFTIPAFIIGILLGAWTIQTTHTLGLLGFLLTITLGWITLKALRLLVTREGHQRIAAWWTRTTSHEYWPNALIYLPVFILFAHRRPFRAMARLTVLNPGYAADAGVDEDSKSTINIRFPNDPAILPLVCIEPNENTAQRLAIATHAIDTNTNLGGYPIIAKPDRGERGFGVAAIDNETQLHAYLRKHQEPIVLQKYHQGPCEVGVLWIRNPGTIENPHHHTHTPHTPQGSIYAITIKHFPAIVGNGKHSIRQLILQNTRYRCQARMFLDRMKPNQHRILEANEKRPLGVAGNHAQGAKFTDGHHLITKALEARIDAIAREFKDENGHGFDLGRFDLRCDSLDALAKGKDFGIVELNGLASEPTNLYDPDKSILWAWRVLRGYWIRAIQLAEIRIATNTGTPIAPSAIRKKFLAWVARGLFSGLKPGA